MAAVKANPNGTTENVAISIGAYVEKQAGHDAGQRKYANAAEDDTAAASSMPSRSTSLMIR